MTRAEIIWPFVEQTLVAILGDRAQRVDDQLISAQHGSSRILVRLLDGDEPRLQFFSPMLHDVPSSPELLETLNELDARLPYVKVFWLEGDVMIATELLAESVDRDSIGNALVVVADAADHFDDELKERFGGETAFPQPEPGGTEEAGGSDGAEGVAEGVSLPPGLEQGERREPQGEGPPEEEPAAAKPGAKDDPDERAGYL